MADQDESGADRIREQSMTFDEMLDQAIAMIQRHGSVTYRALESQFQIDHHLLETLKEQLLYSQPRISDDGNGLVWAGESAASEPDDSDVGSSEPQFQLALYAVLFLLQRDQRVTYRALRHIFGLDDGLIEAIRTELVFRHLAVDENDDGLVWMHEHPQMTLNASPPMPSMETTTDVASGEQLTLPEPTRSAPEAERRQLTVMFCDLVGSTDLAGRLDPEALREVVRAYQETAAQVVDRYEGHIAQYLGDGLLIYFGWPRSHEDNAQRAVHAGLGIVEAINKLNVELKTAHQVQLAVRIGIHTGQVVIGEMGGGNRHENLALGETPNIAARLEGLAQPGTVIMSETTRQLTAGTFDVEDLGTPSLKGVTQAIQVFQVRGVRTVTSRFEATTAALTALVGREVELELLMRGWEQAAEGEGQVVILGGPPGMGKSRLLQALRARLTDVPHMRLRYQCSPYHTTSAFYPIVNQMTHAMQVPPDATSRVKLDRLETLITEANLPLEESTPLFAQMLSIPLNDRYPPLTLNAQSQKNRTIELYVQGLLNLAVETPLLMVVEDLHWMDPTSLELLSHVISQSQHARILMVATHRPEFEPPWGDLGHVTLYALNCLSRRQTANLIEQAGRGKALPLEVIDQILEKTDGIPLFVEELTKHVLESDWLVERESDYELNETRPSLAIPVTLKDSLMARLDRLANGKDVVQLSATIGREFSYRLLQALTPLSNTELQDELDQLLQAELITQRGVGVEATYQFKHALIQDAAYQSMLRRTRQQRHQEIAQVLEYQFIEVVDNQPELLAHHYTEAGLHEPAVTYWRQAGQRAFGRFANQEAAVSFEHALTALAHLPEQPETLEVACDVRLDLRNALLPLGEVDRIHDILRESIAFGERLGDPTRLGRLYQALTHNLRQTNHLLEALTTGERALALTAQSEMDGDYLWTNLNVAQIHHMLGNYPQASERFQHNVDVLVGDRLFDQVGGAAIISVTARRWLAQSLAEMGRFTEGQARGEEAIRIAEEAEHPFSLANAYMGMGALSLCKGKVDQAITFYSKGLDICQRWNIRALLAAHAISLSQTLAVAGQIDEAFNCLEQTVGLPTSIELGRRAISFAELYLHAGRLEEASQFGQRTLELVSASQERGLQAGVLRLLGEIAIKSRPVDIDTVESHYQQALSLAEELGMRPLQAHCHRGLGILYSHTGHSDRARVELAAALDMYQNMDMTFWLPATEAALAEVEELL